MYILLADVLKSFLGASEIAGGVHLLVGFFGASGHDCSRFSCLSGVQGSSLFIVLICERLL